MGKYKCWTGWFNFSLVGFFSTYFREEIYQENHIEEDNVKVLGETELAEGEAETHFVKV